MKNKEKIELCSRIFIAWKLSNKAWNVHDDEILDAFIPGMLVKKMKAFGVDIFLPDPLLLLIDVCTESNPGQAQIVLKDLLNSIVERTGKIKKGYMISAEDVAECWPTSFPIVSLKPELYVGRSPYQVEVYLRDVVNPVLEANKEELGVTAEINV